MYHTYCTFTKTEGENFVRDNSEMIRPYVRSTFNDDFFIPLRRCGMTFDVWGLVWFVVDKFKR